MKWRNTNCCLLTRSDKKLCKIIVIMYCIFKFLNFEYLSRILLYRFLFTIRKGIYSHKWCMHSNLPIASRVKQPAPHFHTSINSQTAELVPSCSHFSTQTSVTPGCGTRPISIGSRRRRAECAEHCGVISIFVHVRFAFGRGNQCVVWTWSEIVPNVAGHYVSQQCQYALVSLESHAWKVERNNIFLVNKVIVYVFNTQLFI
jgi:hypothetical protein